MKLRKILCVFLTLCLFHSCLVMTVSANSSESTETVVRVTNKNGTITDFQSIEDAITSAENDSTLTLLKDVELSNCLDITKNLTITSENKDLPKMITTKTNEHGYLIRVNTGGTAVFKNIVVDGGSAKGLTAKRAAIAVSGGTLKIQDGTIIRNNNNTTEKGVGGGICVISGIMEMNGGLITNNIGFYGGGIGMVGGYCVAKAGTIEKNYATVMGGGINVWEMGLIENNTVGKIKVSGTLKVSNNSANYYAGGINCHMDSEICLEGSPIIEKNTSAEEKNGGIYLDGSQSYGDYAVVKIGNLGENSSIRFCVFNPPENLIIAKPDDNYTITETDLLKISLESETHYLKIGDDGNIILAKNPITSITQKELPKKIIYGDTVNLGFKEIITETNYDSKNITYRWYENDETLGTSPDCEYKANDTNEHTIKCDVSIAGYTITEVFTVKADKKPLTSENITDIPDQIYSGSEIEPIIELKDGDNILSLGTDYTVTYEDNINTGVAKAIITIITPNYSGSLKKEFNILKRTVSSSIVLTAPVKNATPQTSIETDEYTATVEWSPEIPTDGTFAKSTEYTATITITPKQNYTVDGIAENGYRLDGATTVENAANSNVVKAVFPKTSGSSTGGGGGTTRYTISFDTNGGSKIASQRIIKNTVMKEPTAPTKDGFKFGGWYTDKELKNKYDFSLKVTNSFTLYAAWTEVKTEPDPTDKPTDESTNPNTEISFEDVSKNDWYYDDVKSAVEKGLFNGITDKIFAPNDNITRGMFVTVLYRADGEPAVNKSIPFSDVSADSYYANAVIWAQQNGIVNGITETEFAPDENITREQIASIMFRYAKYKGYDVSIGENTNILSYDDSFDISEYAIPAMQYAAGAGLIKGKTETTLKPKDFATRAEIAAILQRFVETNK